MLLATRLMRVCLVLQSFAVELRAEDHDDLDYDSVKAQVERAGGANYGTGIRD